MLKENFAKPKYDNIVLSGSPIVNISKQAWDKIKYLCKHINVVEWSGCIFYKFINDNASIINKDSLDIEIVDLIPLDKGSESFTEYTFDSRVLTYMTDMNYFDLKIGHCHSHHNMNTFFSGTDMSELNDNSEFIKPYLSLIVNNVGDFSCRLATRLEKVNPSYECQDINNNKLNFKIDDSNIVVAYYECKVRIPEEVINVSDKFIKQYESIVVAKAQKFNNSLAKNTQSALDSTYSDLFSVDSYATTSYEESNKLACYLLRLGKKIKKDTIDNALEDIDVSIKTNQLDLDNYVHSLVSNLKTHINNFFDKKLDVDDYMFFVEEFTDSISFDIENFDTYEHIITPIINALSTMIYEQR
jgi:hypothetical protein